MAPSLTSSSGSDFIFQVAPSDILPAIGTGFDAINGQAIDASGFEPPALAELNTQQRNLHQSKYFSIYDASSLEDAANFDMESSGGGWGASVGMTFSASARVKTTATSFTVHFNGASTSTQAMVKASTPLSNSAREKLKSGIADFIETYGSHFIAGYIYGTLCKLSYNMQFKSIDAQVAFTATYNESASELGFTESTKASLSNTLTTSNTRCSIDVESNCRGYQTISPSTFEDLILAKSDFDKADANQSATPIAIMVMPWYYLSEVTNQVGLGKTDLNILVPLLNKWIYISNTCAQFIGNNLYTGHTQLAAVRAVLKQANDAQAGLLNILDQINTTKGSTLKVIQGSDGVTVNGTQFAYPDQMLDDMNFALQNFVLSFSVVEFAESVSVLGDVGLVDLQGNKIPVEKKQVHGQTGSYFNWSNAHAGDWEGTQGTQSARHDIASLNGSDRVALVLDSEKGTVQCWYCGAVQTLAQNLRNDPISIRGKATSKNCDDAQNRDRSHCQLGSLTINVSPM